MKNLKVRSQVLIYSGAAFVSLGFLFIFLHVAFAPKSSLFFVWTACESWIIAALTIGWGVRDYLKYEQEEINKAQQYKAA